VRTSRRRSGRGRGGVPSPEVISIAFLVICAARAETRKWGEVWKIEEGHLMTDHVHMLISIPPKYSVAEVVGFIKGKSSIWVAQNVERKAKNFAGHHFWARGYFVSTVGRDEETIRAYIKHQELQDKQMDQQLTLLQK
jgi:putative transposase